MPEAKNLNVIRIDDLNVPIFRTYSLKWFLQILAKGNDVLRSPSTWGDPFENFFLSHTQVAIGEGQLADLSDLARDWYGQCWTTNSDTDAMWRIYSADKTGIQVRTTARKLYENLTHAPSVAPQLQLFIGRVEYMSAAKITDKMGTLTFADVAIGGQGDNFADLLCIKREAFAHESEVRILFQDLDLPRKGSNNSFVYPLDVNSIFEEIVLDPRLENAAATKLEGELRAAGCKIPIRRSDLYQAPHFIIPVQ